MKTKITIMALLLMVMAALTGCLSVVETEPVDGIDFYGDYYKDYYRRPITIRGVGAYMPNESAGPICGTVGVLYCRSVILLTKVPYETDIATIRWEFDGRPMPEWDDQESFYYNFSSTGMHHVRVEMVDEFDRSVVYDGPFRVATPRSDYENPWYRY